MKTLNVFTEGNTGLGKQGSTSACDRGGGNMRGRGQTCQSAWVSVEIIETVHTERSVRGGKTFSQKTDGKPTSAVELSRN